MPASLLDKRYLRAACKSRRAVLGGAQRSAFATAAAGHFLNSINYAGKIVAGYCPAHNEIDVMPLLHALIGKDISCCMPVIAGQSKELVFRRWLPGMALESGPYGISAPPMHAEALTPQIVIVPLLGYSDTLHRIGYGAGYYDATLRRLRATTHPLLAVGFAFSAQRLEYFTPDAHDEPLDAIATENGIVKRIV